MIFFSGVSLVTGPLGEVDHKAALSGLAGPLWCEADHNRPPLVSLIAGPALANARPLGVV